MSGGSSARHFFCFLPVPATNGRLHRVAPVPSVIFPFKIRRVREETILVFQPQVMFSIWDTMALAGVSFLWAPEDLAGPALRRLAVSAQARAEIPAEAPETAVVQAVIRVLAEVVTPVEAPEKAVAEHLRRIFVFLSLIFYNN